MQRKSVHRAAALVLALVLTLALCPRQGQAKLDGVYLGAVNDRLLVDMSLDAMPFWSKGVFYVPSIFFEGTDIDVHYVRNGSMHMAMLYDSRVDLRFDLETGAITDRKGNTYNGVVIQKNGRVFLPIDLISRSFDITWAVLETEVAPLVRIKNGTAILSDKAFVSAATDQMKGIYGEYERQSAPVQPPEEQGTIHATQGQKVHLLTTVTSAQGAMEMMEDLGTAGVTFLLPLNQFRDGDLLRSIVARGHGIALYLSGTTPEERRMEVAAAREYLWDAALLWLDQVWYEGETDRTLEDLGCLRVTARLDWQRWGVPTETLAKKLLTTIGKYRGDLGVLLGPGDRGWDGLSVLLEELENGGYRLCPWRPKPQK